MKLELSLINHSSIPMPRQWIEKWTTALSRNLPKQAFAHRPVRTSLALTVVFLNVAAAKKLNSDLRDKTYATDILSFESEQPDELGELVLCPQVLLRQAKMHQLSFRADLGYMLIHGVLHLLGYDHETTKNEAKKMFQIQDQLFDRMRTKFDI